jgi:hypothetical protein
MTRPKSPRGAGKVEKNPPSKKKQKSPSQPRQKEPWPVSVHAIDTTEAMNLNWQLAQQLLGGPPPGWDRIQKEARESLGLDIGPLCRAFDEANRGCLPRGIVHLWIEPVLAHFTHHRCWNGPATEQACGFARSLYVLGAALEQLRVEEWRARVLGSIRDLRRKGEQAVARLVDDRTALLDALTRERRSVIPFEALLQGLQRQIKLQEDAIRGCDETTREQTGAAHLLGGRASARPALVFAEAELLAIPIDDKRVSELILDERNDSNGRKRVYSRSQLPTYELRLQIVRPAT